MELTPDQQRVEDTRDQIREEERVRRKRRFKIDISEQERYMLLRPIERLKPNERTPQEHAFLKFLEELPKLSEGGNYILRSPGPNKRVRKLEPKVARRSKNVRPLAQKLAKKAQKAKKYGGGPNKAPKYKTPEPKKRGKKKTSDNGTKPTTKRRASWRGV